MNVTREMPKYRCHKEVHALKVKSVNRLPNPDPTGNSVASSYGAIITPDHVDYGPFEVSAEFDSKHRPEPGGYYVVYEDGYQSYSPASAFESGYTLIA